jgi:hypothetical protein
MSEAVSIEDAVVVRDEVSVVKPSADVGEAFEGYQKLQGQLDRAMPECIIVVGDKKFRTKKYWMAVATAFGVDAQLVEVPRYELAEDGDWGYVAHARAVAPNGRTMDAMGACFASEKRSGQDTRHNVLGHAETRAKLRAISNLVGFGEVSADELTDESAVAKAPAKRKPRAAAKPAPAASDDSPSTVGSHFDDDIGFGKFKNVYTWRQMTEGAIDGDRHNYLKYLAGQIDPNENKWSRERYDRVTACLAVYGKRLEDETPPEDGTRF